MKDIYRTALLLAFVAPRLLAAEEGKLRVVVDLLLPEGVDSEQRILPRAILLPNDEVTSRDSLSIAPVEESEQQFEILVVEGDLTEEARTLRVEVATVPGSTADITVDWDGGPDEFDLYLFDRKETPLPIEVLKGMRSGESGSVELAEMEYATYVHVTGDFWALGNVRPRPGDENEFVFTVEPADLGDPVRLGTIAPMISQD